MKKKLVLIAILSFLLSSLFFSLPSSISAAEFSSAYRINYQVEESGITKVQNQIRLTNLKSNLYAKEYSLIMETGAIENISAFDSQGELEIKTEKNQGRTKITVQFNKKVVGKGKTLEFTIVYETAKLAKKLGRIWEINLPPPMSKKDISSYQVTLSVPESFGKPAYLKPKPAYGLTWTENQTAIPIMAVFGQFQASDFNLSYHLKNRALKPYLYQVALPPDTAYQKIVLEKINPQPKNIIVDQDGNWLAQYYLLPQQATEVIAQGQAFTVLPENISQEPFFSQKADNFSLKKELSSKYLESQKFWPVEDPEIKKLAQQLKTPENIYRYVVNNLSYSLERVNDKADRLGAKKALANPNQAVCTEFTDLFITLCRAAGIPAREINGYGQSGSPFFKPLSLVEDVLHAWPEYYDSEKNLWVPVDPTWEKTTQGLDYFHQFDFNHLTLVIHGLSSEKPAPPGAYIQGEEPGEKKKSVQVNFADHDLPKASQNPKLKIDFPQKVSAGQSFEGIIRVENPGPQALYNLRVEVLSSHASPKKQELEISALPPYGSKEFKVEFSTEDFFFWGKNEFLIRLNNTQKKTIVNIQPLFINLLPYATALFLIFLIFSLSLLLFKRFDTRTE